MPPTRQSQFKSVRRFQLRFPLLASLPRNDKRGRFPLSAHPPGMTPPVIARRGQCPRRGNLISCLYLGTIAATVINEFIAVIAAKKGFAPAGEIQKPAKKRP